MKLFIRLILTTLCVYCSAWLAGCVTLTTDPATLYDLGPLSASPSAPPSAADNPALPALRAISVAEITAPAWLDSTMMFYRLRYANELQPRPYAQGRWTMPPAQLLTQRLKARIAHAGGVVLSASNGAANVPVLRIEVDDFIQTFESPVQSTAHVTFRASLFQGRQLLAHKTFTTHSVAPQPDAAGGVRALSVASDRALGDLLVWLAALPLK